MIVFYYFLMEKIGIVREIQRSKSLFIVHDGAYYLLLGLLMPYILEVEMLASLYKATVVEKFLPCILFGKVIIGFILPWVLSPVMKSMLKENGYMIH